MEDLARRLEALKASSQFDRRLVESAPLLLNLSDGALRDADIRDATEKTKQIVNEDILRKLA